MILEPTTQAMARLAQFHQRQPRLNNIPIPLTQVMIHPRASLDRAIFTEVRTRSALDGARSSATGQI